jgi:hypothetical protein
MKNNTAIFDAIKKTITFMFNDELFIIDLTEGDLCDSWQGITTKDNNIFDTNFSYCDNKFYFTIYPVEKDLTTIFEKDIKFDIIQQIGTKYDYLGNDFENQLLLEILY